MIPTMTPCSMAYREAYCTHLPSPTTLYSGARVCSSLSETQPVHTSTRKYHHHPPHQREVRVVSRFATAQQSIEVGSIAYRRIPAEGGEGEVVNFTYDCYEGDRLPRGPQHLHAGAGAEMLGDAEDATDPLTCVAHSCLPHTDNVKGDKSSSGGMEAFILRRIDSSTAGTTTDASTVAEGGSSDRQPKQHRRHVSGSGSAGASSLRMVDSLDSMTIDSITGLDASSMAGMGSTPPKAILVVSGLRVSISSLYTYRASSEDATVTVTCERPLNYIPLAIRATTLVHKDGKESVAVFVSGDDDARLHLYMPKEERSASSRAVGIGMQPPIILEEVPISLTSTQFLEAEEKGQNLLSFSSPIMSIDCLRSKTSNQCDGDVKEENDDSKPTNYLAMGCQDGTIRVVSYTYNINQSEHTLTAVACSDLVVDGPIVTLDISASSMKLAPADSSAVPKKTLVVGSLCGFACAFHQSGDADRPFDGPEEIISNLWCGRIGAEDGVLCVKSICVGGRDRLHGCIAIGTYSGRVLVFEQSNDSSSGYKLHWSCHLPYPIHAISAADLDGDGVNEILVTTRRSLHVFSSCSKSNNGNE